MEALVRIPSPLGEILLTGSDAGLSGLWFTGQRNCGGADAQPVPLSHAPAPLQAGCRWLDDYFAGARPNPGALPLTPANATPFRRLVWQQLLAIPYGTVTTYGALAARIAPRLGRPSMSAQAVGGAVGHNPLSLIIPCHRVVGADGSLTGYAGGLERKRWLLAYEGIDLSAPLSHAL